MNNTKKIIVIILGIALYVRGFILGYVSPMLGGWMFATGLIYMLMHYLVLSRRDVIRKFGWVIRIVIGVITICVIAITKNIWLGISALLWHTAIRSFVESLEDELINRRKFNKNTFFLAGGTFFSIFFTLSFITAFIGRNQNFTLTCEEITAASTSVLSYTEKTFNIGVHQVDTRKGNLIGNIFGDPEPKVETVDEPSYDTGSFMGMLQVYKQQIIDATVSNQKNVSQKVCQVFIDQIGELYEKPGFRVSVILLMFLFISPLLRLTLFIISGIDIAIFMLLKQLGFYKVVKETVEIDKVV